MDIKEIRRIVQLMASNELEEFEWSDEGRRLRIKRQTARAAEPAPVAAAAAPSLAAAAAPEPEEEPDNGWVPINAPIVGTFYRSSSPDIDPFVRVGDRVEKGAVCCIIEAMKVMNEIQAEQSGIIREILAEDATPVEYGQPLFLIEPI